MIQKELWERLHVDEGWDRYVSNFNKQDLIAHFKNGSSIYFRSCDRPDDLRGPNLGWYAIDEASKVPESAWKIMVARLRRPPERAWISTTPKGRNWVWEEFARKHRRNYEVFVGSTDENKNLSKEYINSLKEAYSGSFLQQEFYGQFVAWEGLVYPTLSVDTHHRDTPTDLTKVKYALAGVDWGWTDPSVILTALMMSDNSLHQVAEYVKKRTPIEDIVDAARDLKAKWDIRTFWCDSARPEYIAELRNAGMDSRKGKKELDPGIAAVTRAIDHGQYHLDYNACPETVNEFERYHYEEDDFGKVMKDRPVDRDNHTMDALRYMIYSQTKVGTVSTRRGFR